MSRMERHKREKDHNSQNSEDNIFVRRQRPKDPLEHDDNAYENQYQQDFYEEEPYYNEVDNNYDEGKPPRKKKKRKVRKRKKHRILRFLIKLLILLIAYSGVAFFLGQKTAQKEAGAITEEQNFNGMSSVNGADNILLLGSDSRGEENSRADAIMVLQLDGPAKKPKLVSFMRDSYVNIPDVGQTKLNASYAYGGADLVRQTLAQNFSTDSKYYMSVDFKTFEKVIDTMFPNGVKIDAEKNMSKNIEVSIKKGEQRMDGLTLLQYARFRMDEEGDFGRVRRQQQVINAIFSELKNPFALLRLPYAAGKAIGYSANNIPISFWFKNLFSIAKAAGGIDRLSVPAKDTWSYGQAMDGSSVLVLDMDANIKAIQEFFEK
ncbi:MAG TPA: LCP family protein [Tetragenococcus sp.]|nr:LCP family protein [Tetragenococcus sp.]